MYANQMGYYETVAKSYPMIPVTVSSLVFDNKEKTRGTIKFFTNSQDFIFFNPKWNDEKKEYEWQDAMGNVFTCRFQKGKDGATFVKLPGKYARVRNDKGDWTEAIGDNGKKIWRDQIMVLDHDGFNRIKALKAILSAMVDVKAGRFKYNTGSESDYYFAYRKVEEGEETPSGYIGVRPDEIEKLREKGIKVYVRTATKSCSNCSNCRRLFESDDSEKVNDFLALPSRAVYMLAEEGPVQPDRLCLARLEMVDIEAADYVNGLSKEDRTSYVDVHGIRRRVRYDQVVISRFQYGTRNVMIGSHGEVDEDGEPVEVKDYVEVNYEDVGEVAVTFEEMKSMRMEAIADECPMWTKADRDYNYYEWPKSDKTCILHPTDGGWEVCRNNDEVKEAGRNFKFTGRYHGIEVTYWKKSPLERQLDFLKDVHNWITDGADTSDTEKIGKWIERFQNEKPVKAVRENWDKTLAEFVSRI